jgi:hypothetical protein
VGAAILEDALRDAIAAYLLPQRRPESDIQLFQDEYAPLQGLAGRTRMALSLGIIDQKVKSDIDDIRAIRIAFAHTPTRMTFANKDVLKLLDSLNTLEDQYFPSDAGDALKILAAGNYDGARFAYAVSLICGALSLSVPFWHPMRSLARALKDASLKRPTLPDPPDQERSDEPPAPPSSPPRSSQG